MSRGAVREPGRHLVVLGPTATGKSAIALAVAERRRSAGELVELITVDSMQVYRGMDIGTATPSADEQHRVPHHLLDIVDPSEEFSLTQFRDAANRALDDIEGRGGSAILVGGTGLYLQAVVDGLEIPGRYPDVAAVLDREPDTTALYDQLTLLDPVAAERAEPGNRRRILRALEVTIGSGRRFSDFGPGLALYPDTPFVLAGTRVDRVLLGERIAQRYDAQMRAGFLDEVRRLDSLSDGLSRTAAQALGYRELLAHLHGEGSLDDALSTAVQRTRQFGVRQIRWFRRDPRISWFDHDGEPGGVAGRIDELWRKRVADQRGSGSTVDGDPSGAVQPDS